MATPNERRPDSRPPATRQKGARDVLSIHPLAALDGVLIYVSRHGETVDFYFGATERSASAAVAADAARNISERCRGEIG